MLTLQLLLADVILMILKPDLVVPVIVTVLVVIGLGMELRRKWKRKSA
jgi:hypothetical protein